MVRCGTCGGENRDGARFCATCGRGLAAPCPACGAVPARAEARFCDACGAELAAAAAVDQARKVVTVLFADLVGSTSAQEGADPEAVRRWVDRYYAILRRHVEANGGRVAKFTGDGVMAVFGIPEVREDDARRAIETATALHAAVADLGGGAGAPERVALRIGVNTGEVVVSSDDDDVVGDVVNVAARLQTAAGAGQVLVGESTFRLVRLGAQLRALPPLELKGKAAPVNAFLLLSLHRGEEHAASPFVGRAGELERLLAVLDDAITSNRARLASIIGSPGVGKTRLAMELTARASDRARVVEVRCDAAGGATFAPIAAAIRQAASLEEDASPETVVAALTALFDEDEQDRDRIAAGTAALLGVGEPGLPEETFWAVRRLIESAGRRGPIVFVFDDVHWAEPLLLDLIENVAEWTRGVPVALVVTARPELRELRPSLVEVGGRVRAAINLEGLEADESRRLTRELVGGADLPEALLDRVAAASEGNPLFVGELVRMLVDDGVLELVDGAWRVTVDLAEIDVPVTIHALLAARIDRLAPGERAVLEAASVVGKTFYRGVLAALLPADVVPHLDEHLEGLRRKELVEPAGTYWLDEPVLRFHHVLIRDAAYRRLLKETRATLHEQAARWLEGKVGDLTEHDDVIGFQLEQAHLLRAEAGDPQAALGQEAADRLAAAGRRALEADDRPVAASLLGRALLCLSAGSDERGQLLVDRCEALLAMGDATEAAGVVAELEEVAVGSHRLEAWATCFAGELANLRDAGALAQTAEAADLAADDLAALDDAAGEAKAHAVRAASLARLGRIAECEASLDRALAAARRANDRRRATAILAGAPVAALWGPNPVTRASGRCLDVVRVLRITSRAPAVEATSLRCQAVLEALRGRGEAARRMLGSARRSLEDLGHEHGLLEVDLAAGMVELLAGEPGPADRLLRRAHEGFHALGVDVDAGLAAALLARVRLDAGDADAALELTVESEKLGGDDLKAGIAWRAVRAQALASRGELEAARRLAEEAVALAAPTDALLDHADALVSLAEVLRAAGDGAGAAERARAALELYERKEAAVPAARARALLDGPLEPAAAPPEPPSPLESTPPLENAATRHLRRWSATFWTEGSEATRASYRPDVAFVDRRPRGGNREAHDVDGFMVELRTVETMGTDGMDVEPVATRGDRLALLRCGYLSHRGDAVATRYDVLQLVEIDDAGLGARYEVFDEDQLAEALARLDERAAAQAGGAARTNAATRFVDRWLPTFLAADWDGVRRFLADDVVGVDHRPVLGGTGVMEGRDAVLEGNQGVLAVGVTGLRMTPIALGGDRAALYRAEYSGASGGLTVLQLAQVTAGDLMQRSEVFEVDQLDQAMARLHELAGPAAPENAAVRMARRGWELIVGEAPANADLLAHDVVIADERPIVGGHTYTGHAEVTIVLGSVETVGATEMAIEAVALRGDCHALTTVELRGEGLGLVSGLQVTSVSEAGLLRYIATYEATQMGLALARLDELGGQAPGNLAVRHIRRGFDLMIAGDEAGLRAHLRPDAVAIDHRALVGGGLTHDGADDVLRTLMAIHALGVRRADFRVVTTHGDRLCLFHGQMRADPEADDAVNVVEALQLNQVDAAGRMARSEVFDPDDVTSAMARFRELAAEQDALHPSVRLFADAWDLFAVGDGEGAIALYDPAIEVRDRRPIVGGGLRIAGDDAIAGFVRSITDIAGAPVRVEQVAVRGARHGLLRGVWGGDDASLEVLAVLGLDERGRVSSTDIYDPSQLAEAMARLEEVANAPDRRRRNHAYRQLRRGFDLVFAGEIDAMRALIAPDVVGADHRRVFGGYTFEGREAFEAGIAGFLEVGVTSVEMELLDTRGDRLVLAKGTFLGSLAAIDALFLYLTDEQGRLLRGEVYDVDDRARATARLDELARGLTGPGGNVAWQMFVHGAQLVLDDDVDGYTRLLAPDIRLVDHRPIVGGIEISGAEAYAEMTEITFDLVSRVILGELLACTGDSAFTVEAIFGGDGGEVEMLLVVGLDHEGRFGHVEMFEPDRRAEALATMDAVVADARRDRPVVRRTWLRFAEFSSVGDVDGMLSLLAPGARCRDHRAIVGGDWTGDALRPAFEAFAASGPVRIEWEPIATRGDHLELGRLTFHGDQTVIQVLSLPQVDEQGRLVAFDMYDLDQVDDALHELERRSPGDRAADETDAVGAYRRAADLAMAGDWEGMAGCFHPQVEHADRRPLVGGFEMTTRAASIAFSRAAFETGVDEMALDLVARRGPGLALFRTRYIGRQGEVVNLEVVGIDQEGLITSIGIHGGDQLLEALAELDDRYLAALPSGVAATWRVCRGAVDALNRRDLGAFRDSYTEDLVLVDRRPAAWGDVDRDELVTAYRTLFEGSPDVHDVMTEILDIAEDGLFVRLEERGTVDGGPFTFSMVTVSVLRDGLMARTEVYASDQLVEAEARWRELRQPRTAGAVARAMVQACNRGEVDEMVRHMGPGSRFTDHRPVVGGITASDDALRGAFEAFVGLRTQIGWDPVATRGGRLELGRIRSHGDGLLIEALMVGEVDEAGLVVAVDAYELDQVDEATAHLEERFLAGEGAGSSAWRSLTDGIAHLNRRDLDGLRAETASGFECVDHRPVGMGTMDIDQYVEVQRGLMDRAAAVRWTVTRDLLLRGTTGVAEVEIAGVGVDAGDFRMLMLAVFQVEPQDGTRRLEIFSADDEAAALARVAELA